MLLIGTICKRRYAHYCCIPSQCLFYRFDLPDFEHVPKHKTDKTFSVKYDYLHPGISPFIKYSAADDRYTHRDKDHRSDK